MPPVLRTNLLILSGCWQNQHPSQTSSWPHQEDAALSQLSTAWVTQSLYPEAKSPTSEKELYVFSLTKNPIVSPFQLQELVLCPTRRNFMALITDSVPELC